MTQNRYTVTTHHEWLQDYIDQFDRYQGILQLVKTLDNFILSFKYLITLCSTPILQTELESLGSRGQLQHLHLTDFGPSYIGTILSRIKNFNIQNFTNWTNYEHNMQLSLAISNTYSFNKQIIEDLHISHPLKIFQLELTRLESLKTEVIFHLSNLEFNYYYLSDRIYTSLIKPVIEIDRFTNRPFINFIPMI